MNNQYPQGPEYQRYNQQQQYPQYQQPQYPQQPQYTVNNYQQYDPTKDVMSVGSYIGMFILSSIPVVNIICWIVWLVSPNTNKNKKNFIIATIVLAIISAVLSVAGFVILGALGYSTTDIPDFSSMM